MSINQSQIKYKKPLSPYALYVKEQSVELKKKNPESNMNDIYKILGLKWHNMNDDEKDIYYLKHEKEFINYNVQKNLEKLKKEEEEEEEED
jgi:upstream-binding transcription factor